MKTLTAKKSFAAVKSQAESIKNDEPQQFPEAASVGDCWRQGDIYITKLEDVGESFAKQQHPQTQLAPGTTQGSRHCLDSLQGVEVFVNPNADVLTGPTLKTTEERTITHPEHGNVILPPGVYGITYQRLHADELRRQMD